MLNDQEKAIAVSMASDIITKHGALRELHTAAERFQREPFSKTAGAALRKAMLRAEEALRASQPAAGTERAGGAL
jgi:hypothetical protein